MLVCISSPSVNSCVPIAAFSDEQEAIGSLQMVTTLSLTNTLATTGNHYTSTSNSTTKEGCIIGDLNL